MSARLQTAAAGYVRRPVTRDEYWRMSELGFFDGQKVQLLNGEIITVSPQGNFHTAAITLTVRALEAVFGPGHWVRDQGTLDLSPLSQPDPDVAVVVGNPRRPGRTVPTTALLVVEVSDSTLADDRGRKSSLYAAAGIRDYWIVNLVDDVLEVYREPRPDATREFGFGYASLTTLRAGDAVSPLAAPAAVVRIDDLLPQ